MSKLIIQLELDGVTEIVDIEASDYAWALAHLYFEFGIPTDDSYIIGTDRYTLDHEHEAMHRPENVNGRTENE